jgi:hypothetical protein
MQVALLDVGLAIADLGLVNFLVPRRYEAQEHLLVEKRRYL